MAEPNALPDPAHLPTGWVRLHPPAISMPVGSGPDDYAAAGLSADSYPTMSALRAALPSVEQTPATPETDSDGGVSTNPSPTREKAEEPRGGLQVDDRTFTFGLTKAEKKAASDALRDIENYEHYYHSAIKRRVENLAEEQQVIQDLSTVNLIGPSGPMVQQLLKRTEKKLQELVTRFQDLETYTGNHLQGKRAILYELGLIREESMTTHHE